MSEPSTRRTLVLDRDGTIIVDHGYLDEPDRVEFLPGAAEALRLWHARGDRLVVVSNQSGVGRGRLSLERLREVNARFVELVAAAGSRIDGLYCCIHRPEDDCQCRKPRTALVEAAAAQLGFEPSAAIVIGDKSSDVELGRRLGALTMLVASSRPESDGARLAPDYIIRDLLEGALILDRLEADDESKASSSAGNG